MEKTNESIAKKALNHYKKDLGDSLLLTLSFFLLAGAALCLGFIGIDFALIGVLTVALPALLSFQLMCLREKKEEGPSNAQTLQGFKLYYTFYFGVYRFWISLLRSILVFTLAFFALSFIVYYAYLAISPQFASEVDAFALLLSQQDTTVNELTEAFSSSPKLIEFSSVCILSCFGIGGYWFVHEIGRNSLNLYIRSLLGGAPSRFANALFSNFFREIRREFYKDYYSFNWPGILLFLFGYAFGAFLGYFFLHNLTFALALAFISACLFLSPYLPYFFFGLDEIAKKQNKAFLKFSLHQAELSLSESKARSEIESEGVEQLKKDVDELKKRLDQEEGESSSEEEENKKD